MPIRKIASHLLAAGLLVASAACSSIPAAESSNNEINPYPTLAIEPAAVALRGDLLPEFGVRKEVYDLINRELHDAPDKLEAALVFAQRLQGVLDVKEGDDLVSREQADKVALAVGCLVESLGGNTAYRILGHIESLTFDTTARLLAWEKFTSKLPRILRKKLDVENPCAADA